MVLVIKMFEFFMALGLSENVYWKQEDLVLHVGFYCWGVYTEKYTDFVILHKNVILDKNLTPFPVLVNFHAIDLVSDSAATLASWQNGSDY